MRTHLTHSSEVIDALGGNAAVAERLGFPQNAVRNWRSAGKFPAKTFLTMHAELVASGLYAPPSLWGQVQLKRGAQ